MPLHCGLVLLAGAGLLDGRHDGAAALLHGRARLAQQAADAALGGGGGGGHALAHAGQHALAHAALRHLGLKGLAGSVAL